MTNSATPEEHHFFQRIGWLRAAVLGANDGIVSTASLIIGVASASAGRSEVLIAGMAALVAGAMSMAAGEYVSVSSQADTEKSDIEIERNALEKFPEEELKELSDIYESRGLDPELALAVATQLTEKDALKAHMRDELGMSEHMAAQPVIAAVSSAVSFSAGAALPLVAAIFTPLHSLNWTVGAASLLSLAALGWISAVLGGARKTRAIFRIVAWGAAAMVATGIIGHLFGTVV